MMKPVHSKKGRSAVKIWTQKEAFRKGNSGLNYHCYDDEAANMAEALGREASSRTDRLATQRNAVCTVHFALISAIIGFYFSTTPSETLTHVTGALLLASGVLFGVICWQIGVAEAYYHTKYTRLSEITLRHYRLRDAHWIADQEYQKAMSCFSFLLDQHSYKVMAFLNFFVPAVLVCILFFT